jgi:hypothetical protein
MAGYLVILPYYYPKTPGVGFQEAKTDHISVLTWGIWYTPPKFLQVICLPGKLDGKKES